MITEIALLYVKENQQQNFEQDFLTASNYIRAINGYIKHSLLKCIEQQNKYILIVEWETLEAHTIGFRTSNEYQNWKKLLHHYYEPFPVVEHYNPIFNF